MLTEDPEIGQIVKKQMKVGPKIILSLCRIPTAQWLNRLETSKNKLTPFISAFPKHNLPHSKYKRKKQEKKEKNLLYGEE